MKSELTAVERAERVDILGLVVVVMGLAMIFGAMALIVQNVSTGKRLAAAEAQLEAQNACLAIAVHSHYTGNPDKALEYTVGAWEAQYDSVPCED